jgi:hypothetical protein
MWISRSGVKTSARFRSQISQWIALDREDVAGAGICRIQKRTCFPVPGNRGPGPFCNRRLGLHGSEQVIAGRVKR